MWMFTLHDFTRIKLLVEEIMGVGREYKSEDESRLSALLYELLIAIQQYSTPLHMQPMNIVER